MKHNKRKCPNGCSLPHRKKGIKKGNNGYTYEIEDYNYCPVCGSLMPTAQDKLKGFFDVYNLHPDLRVAERLLLKSEFESAAREAFVVVENALREKSGLDFHGVNLATQALAFKYDKINKAILEMPLIAISDLSTESKRNEQDGLKHLIIGFFKGQRNLYQHNHIGSGVSNVIAVIIEASFILHLLDGHSVAEHGRWIRIKTSSDEIISNMPKLKDRIRYIIENRVCKGMLG